MNIYGLGFKFVDVSYKSSDVCHTEIKMISSENILLPTVQDIKHSSTHNSFSTTMN